MSQDFAQNGHPRQRRAQVSFRTAFPAFGLVLLLLMPGALLAAVAGVSVSPPRVVFEGRERATRIRVINGDLESGTYRLSLVTIRRDVNGKPEEISDPALETEAEKLAKSMIRFAPRKVAIAGKQWQTVRVMASRPKDLPDGEYRTHLKVIPLPNARSGAAGGQGPSASGGGTSISLDLMVGVTIPVIVRQGEMRLKVVPRSATVEINPRSHTPVLRVDLERQGNRSVLMNVAVRRIASETDTGERIGEAKGVAIYTPNENRILDVPLDVGNGRSLSGLVRVEVRDRETEGEPLVGSAVFRLP